MIHHGPIVKLERRVREGIAREAAAGETGGILLGRRQAEQILIDDFEPVLCEHRFGAAYLLSDHDLRGLEESADWFRTLAGSHLEVLGFYRSEPRPDFSWNERDEEVMRRFFPESGSLLLLLKPGANRGTGGEFYLHEEGILHPASGPERFALEESGEIALFPEAPVSESVAASEDSAGGMPAESARPALPGESTGPALAAETRPTAAETRPSERHQVLPPPTTRPRRLDSEEAPDRSWLWVAALVVLTLVGALLGYRSVEPSAPSPARKEQPRPAGSLMPAATVAISAPASADPAPAPLDRSPADPPLSPGMERGVRDAIDRWQQAIRSGDAGLIGACYAPQMERYFNRRNSSSAQVRKAVMQSVAHYGRPAILRISALSIVPVSDDRAIATLRKHWQTRGPKVFAGEEQERLTFVRFPGGWKIAAEEETRVYWTQRPK